MAKTPKPEIEKRVASAAAILQITHLLDRRPDQLSGGQRQRVAIGRALVRDAAVFLFDEPLSNLDAKLRNELRVEIKRLHAQLGNTTMIYVTHDQIEAMTLADRIVGHEGAEDPAARQPARDLPPAGQPVRRRLRRLAADELHQGPARGRRRRAGVPVGRTHACRWPATPSRGSPALGQDTILGVRPEHLELDRPGTWPGFTIDIVEPMGADMVIWCSDPDGTLQVRTSGNRKAAPGDALSLAINPAEVSLFAAESGERL